jgi:orotate phosphoribosyltransferase
MNTPQLFEIGDFILHSGQRTNFRINCDVLTAEVWRAIAAFAAPIIGDFTQIHSIPRGGDALANAMQPYANFAPTPRSVTVLICDDVLTTGASMKKAQNMYPDVRTKGLVLYARGPAPNWIKVVFTLSLQQLTNIEAD